MMTSPSIPPPTASPSSLQALTFITTSSYARVTETYSRDIDTEIREFWSSFPCPPPWRPRLLAEINGTRHDPWFSKTISFLAGKCHIRHVLANSVEDYNLESSDLIPGLDLRPTDSPDPGSSRGDPATSIHQWCDSTCQLSFGCAILLVVVVFMVALVICLTKHRVRNKMAAARPSRQQLQLSTSTSDAVNCTEFSNLEVGAVDRSRGVNVSVVHGDDDFIYPPFRHRGLPHPPATCHPSCDPQWNCSNCSSCHPLMRMSPPDLYYSRAYSAVYESVEDDEDDAIQRSENEGTKQQSCTSPVNTDCIDQMHSCIPCQVSPTSISTVQLRPRTYDDIINRHLIAETGFNGEERLENNASSTIHKYFELEQNVALSGQNDWGINQDYNFTNSLGICINSGESYNPGSTGQSNNPLVTAPCQQDILNHSQIQPYHTSDIHRHSTHCADDLYKYISNEESVEQTNEKMNSEEQQNVSLDQSQIFNNQRTDSNRFDGSNIHYLNNRGKQTIQPKHVIPAGCNVSQMPYSNHVCTSASTFLRDIPTHYYCPSCQHDTASSCVRPQRFAHEQHNVANDHNIHRVNVGPDLLKEASNPSRVKEPEMTPPNDLNNDNAEVPLRKPVLALHSHYFAKTWVA